VNLGAAGRPRDITAWAEGLGQQHLLLILAPATTALWPCDQRRVRHAPANTAPSHVVSRPWALGGRLPNIGGRCRSRPCPDAVRIAPCCNRPDCLALNQRGEFLYGARMAPVLASWRTRSGGASNDTVRRDRQRVRCHPVAARQSSGLGRSTIWTASHARRGTRPTARRRGDRLCSLRAR